MQNKRLIDAGDLWSDIMMLPHNGDMISSEEVEQVIQNATTVDAVEVVHGHWIETDEGTICSECNEHPFVDGYLAIANYNGDWCPNCGAKMDGGSEING